MTDQPSPYGGAPDVSQAPRIRIPHLKQMIGFPPQSAAIRQTIRRSSIGASHGSKGLCA